MSIIVSAATLTAVSASISTPVRSAVFTFAIIATPELSISHSTVTECRAIGWQSGIKSGVRFAPMIPAIRAVARTSPFGTVLSRSIVITSAERDTCPLACAVRTVTSRSLTSTICD